MFGFSTSACLFREVYRDQLGSVVSRAVVKRNAIVRTHGIIDSMDGLLLAHGAAMTLVLVGQEY